MFKFVLAAALGLAVYHEDRDPRHAKAKAFQMDAIAKAVALESQNAPRSPREWAALMLTIAYHESRFSLRIHDGKCDWGRKECDAALVKGRRVFRARGLWQNHLNLHTAYAWDQMVGIQHTDVQAKIASAMLKRAYWTCRREKSVDWVTATINGYRGGRCGDLTWPGMAPRIQTYRRLISVPHA